MQHDEDEGSHQMEFAAGLELEFQAWRKLWLGSLMDDYGDLARIAPPMPGFRLRIE